MITLLSGAWRNDLAGLAASAEQSLLIAAPYIKEREAAWLCSQLRSGLSVTTMTNVNVEAIGSATLDVAALRRLSSVSPLARLISLPTLHAKVFVADDHAAIVTSGNLTSSALDHNVEYGVLLQDHHQVKRIRGDMLNFAHLGSEVSPTVLGRIGRLERKLRETRSRAIEEGVFAARRELADAIQQARPIFVATQVGTRTKSAVFSEAVQYVLARGPLPTGAIHEQVKSLLPDLCDDAITLVINGERFGKAWKHDVRNAQQFLVRRGAISLDKPTGLWSLI